MQKIHRNKSQRNRKKKCCHGNTCCQVCRKSNPPQSVQGYGKQRTHKIFISPRNRKKVLPWQHLLPGVAEKLISCSLCRGMESKESIKIFTSPRNKKKCCHGNTCQVCRKTNQFQSVQGYGKQRTYKNICKSKKRKKCCHGNTCCQVLPKS